MQKLRVGVIGLGMGAYHLKSYAQCPDAQVVALCDVDEGKLQGVLKDYPGVAGFSDYTRMLKLKELDAVSVALPNYLHAPVTIEALRAGKHVLCEKPMAMNAREAERMKAVAEKARKILMMHFNVRFMTTAVTLKPLIAAGTLGEIYHVTTTYTRRDGYPRPGGWFGQRKLSGGGPLIDLGVHRIDLALWLIGYPKPVAAMGNVYNLMARRKLKGMKFDCEDFGTAMIRFENGCTMYATASWDGHQKVATELTMAIYGAEGSVFEREGQLTLCRKESGVNTVSVLDPVQPRESPQQHFVSCVLQGTKPGPSAEHGIIVMKILDAIYKSAETRKEVTIR